MEDSQKRNYWTFFAAESRALRAPLYARIAEGTGDDDELRALAENALPGQPLANVLLGAVHYLLLRGADHPLRGFYPNLNGGNFHPDGDPFPVFRDFVMSHRETLLPLISGRITNTNETGRCVALHPAFHALAARAGTPLHLIELGPSAGLNLNWDRYGVRYRHGDSVYATGVADAALVIDTELRGEAVPPLGLPPAVASRVGLERNPVDLGDPDARDWLRALVWPEHVERFVRLERALAIADTARPNILSGDGLSLLPDVLARLPKDGTVCLYHTLVTYQFTQEMREALADILAIAGLRRPIWRLGLEWTGDRIYPLRLTEYRDGAQTETILAHCDPHGAWIEWHG